MDVVGIDIPVMDFLVHVDKIPETNNGTHLIEYGWQGGGKVATALVALGRLGVKTGMIGVVGEDSFGKFCINDFELHEVDTSNMVIDKGTTTTFCVCISERQTLGRSIIGKRGTSRALEIGDLNREYITAARYLHLTNMDPVARQAAVWARESGVKVAFDADSYHQETADNIELIDVFIASEFFYRKMFDNDDFEENCRSIQRKGPSIVVFTFGEKGCLGVGQEGFFNIPAFEIDAVDTTGAGDVYHGAFIFGLLKGWSTEETARFASAVSAIKCTRVGGRAGIPDLAAAKRYLIDGEIDYSGIDKRVDYYRNNILSL